MTRPLLFGLLSAVAALAAGCGPVQYITKVGDASNAHAQAEREDAQNSAPYEFTAASEYLKKAREEAGRSQFDTAVAYSARAEEMSHKARAISRENRVQGKTADKTAEKSPAAVADPFGAGDAPEAAEEPAPVRNRRGRQK